MTLDQAMGPSRTAPYIAARTAVYAALRAHGWSLKKIAIFCRRDHTTVLNALQPKERNR
jgi:chromosomal replication initiation ATPase DnaA